MAFKHRKLYPTLTETNQTIDCLDFCDSTCPYDCYTYPFIIPPSSSPPPPPPPLTATNQNSHISPYVIVIVSLLAGFFLLVSYYVIIVKYCSNWNSLRNRPAPSQSDGTDEEHLDENHGPVVDHPIWFITTAGLQQAIINSITVCKYKRGEGLIEGTECSVCLSEFQEDETLRLLPKCNHAFHIHCIDTWLRSHTNCPLCRARIVSDAVSPNLASVQQNYHNLSANEETRVENHDSDGELGGDQATNGHEVCENRAEIEDESGLQQVEGETISKDGVNCNWTGSFRVRVDFGGDDQVIEDEIQPVRNHQVIEDEIQPVRRTVSMDFSPTQIMCLHSVNLHSVESEGSSADQIVDVEESASGIVPKLENRNSKALKLVGTSSFLQTLHKSPDSIKRSFSCGGKFFLSTHNRDPNSLLPL